MKVGAIIAAGGIGKRMGVPSGKQFIKILGIPVISWALIPFEKSSLICEIILVINKENKKEAEELVKTNDFKKVKITVGGAEREDSVFNGLKMLSSKVEAVLIHDGARALVTEDIISRCIKALEKSDAAVAGVPVSDTIKMVGKDLNILKTIDRSKLWSAQTPQGFKLRSIRQAYEKAKNKKFIATDDAMLLESIGKSVKMIMGSLENIKITRPEDLRIAEAILKSRGR
ncbi:MAG: 2-C-methyl-D-erythritol 4-phosphate cytidylyltransferase [Candidatus Saganbacteria bacterium]|nr:2-C-methyl-D-erythritol 4-phosphate cytidylyltransferase [Candidatus Saganbacteria bacterium]